MYFDIFDGLATIKTIYTVIGKAGGLVGKRSDILIANKVYYDKSHELVNINTGNPDIELIEKMAKTKVNLEPMLTVSGTIYWLNLGIGDCPIRNPLIIS